MEQIGLEYQKQNIINVSIQETIDNILAVLADNNRSKSLV